MSANVHRLNPRSLQATPVLNTARVTGSTPHGVLIDLPNQPHARVAVSCLLEPQAGDTVLVSSVPDSSDNFILAILERPDATQGVLSLPGNTHINLGPDQIELQAGTLALNSRKQIDISSGQVNVTAAASRITINHCQGGFDTVEASAVHVSLVAKTLSSRLGRLIQRAVESFRKTDGLDEVHAGRSTTRIEGHQQTRAGHVTTIAEGFVKIDGQKIDLG